MKMVYLVMCRGFVYDSDTYVVGAFETREEAEALVKECEDEQNTPDENGYVTTCPDYYYIEEQTLGRTYGVPHRS